jgi:multidrug efflux pump subunit AcrB
MKWVFSGSPYPVFVGYLLIIIVCAAQVFKIPLTLLPAMQKPVVRLIVEYSAMSPKEAHKLMEPYAEQLKFVTGLEQMEYIVQSEKTLFLLHFDYSASLDKTRQEVRSRLDVVKVAPGVNKPILLTSSSEKMYDMKLLVTSPHEFRITSEYVENFLLPRLRQLEGVAFLDVSGTVAPIKQITLDPVKMNYWGLNSQKVKSHLTQSNLYTSSFPVLAGRYRFGVEVKQNDVSSRKEIQNTVISEGKKGMVRVKDVGVVTNQILTNKGIHYFNDQRSVAIKLYTNDRVRVSDLMEEIRALIQMVEKEDHVHVEIVQDQTKLLFQSIDNLLISLVLGGVIIFSMFYFFMGDTRLPLLIGLMLPLSVLISLGLMSFSGLSLNIISLSGLALGLGLLIDNAIILVENIVRYHQTGYSASEACEKGVKDIISPLLGSNITTIGIFVPLLAGSGVVGILFKEEALVISFTILTSLILSFTLIPVLYRVVFRGKSPRADAFAFIKIYSLTHRISISIRNYPRTVIAFFLFGITLSIGAFNHLTIEYLPFYENHERTLEIPGDHDLTSLSIPGHTIEYIKGPSGYLLDQSEAQNRIIISGPQAGAMADSLKKRYGGHVMPSVNTFSDQLQTSEPDVVVKVYGKANQFISPLEKSDMAFKRYSHYNHAVFQFMHLPVPEASVEKLFNNMDDVLYEGIRIGTTINRPSLERPGQRSIWLNDVTVTLQSKEPIKLKGDLNGLYEQLEYTWNDYQQAQDGIIKKIRDANVPVSFEGGYFKGQKIQKYILTLGVICFLLLYMILVIQFESLRWPLIILSVLPVGLAGSFIALKIIGQSLNVMSGIGILAMLGIVVNDAILKASAVKNSVEGVSLDQRLEVAHRIRLKPVLMTTGTTILSCLPMYFLPGLGNELQVSLITAIIGGLLTATPAALFLLPALIRLGYRNRVHANWKSLSG